MHTNFDEIPGFLWLFEEISLENDISTKFPHIFKTPIVLIHAIFWMRIRFARWFNPNFQVIIRSSWKVTAIFRTIIRSSWKFNLLFINRPRAFFKHSLLTEIYNWPFQFYLSSVLRHYGIPWEAHALAYWDIVHSLSEPTQRRCSIVSIFLLKSDH